MFPYLRHGDHVFIRPFTVALCTATMKLGVLKGSVHLKKNTSVRFLAFSGGLKNMLSTSTSRFFLGGLEGHNQLLFAFKTLFNKMFFFFNDAKRGEKGPAVMHLQP